MLLPEACRGLPCFDRDATQITYDLWHGSRKLLRDGSEPAFPFGFGLSSTSFAYANLQLERTDVGAADTLAVTVDVPKSGSVAGDEVVHREVSASSHGSAASRQSLHDAPGPGGRLHEESPPVRIARCRASWPPPAHS